MADSEDKTQSVSNQNITSVFDYFTNDETNTRTKCNVKGCTKDFPLSLNEVLARNYISRSHHKEWAALEKVQDKPSSKKSRLLQEHKNNKISSRSNINNEDDDKDENDDNNIKNKFKPNQ
ncbi:7807_t:CDS:1, partial [Cetraspora pellucida]